MNYHDFPFSLSFCCSSELLVLIVTNVVIVHELFPGNYSLKGSLFRVEMPTSVLRVGDKVTLSIGDTNLLMYTVF